MTVPLRISSVKVTISTISCGFGHIEKNFNRKSLFFFCSELTQDNKKEN